MKFITTMKSSLGAIYNKVAVRKEGLKEYVRRKCDDIPPQRRFRIVATAFVVFALLALFVFGRSIYNIYNGTHSSPDFGNIKMMPMPDKGDEPKIENIYGSESSME